MILQPRKQQILMSYISKGIDFIFHVTIKIIPVYNNMIFGENTVTDIAN